MLQSYYEHVKENPETLISRIFGLHRVKQANTKKYIYFVVMGNVFPPNRDIHQVFDLKGSTFGRFTNPEESKNNPSCVLKDLNWIQQEQKICLGPIKEKLLKTQLEKDIAFCEKENIMDYSLLIGIHDLKKGNTETFRGKSLIVLDVFLINK